MKLFLAAQAKHPQTIKQLKEFVGGSFTSKNIIYIPTAANGEGWGSWHDSRTIAIVKTFDARLNIVELENTTFEKLQEKLSNVDIVWMAGGMPGYLLYWIRRRKLDVLLKQLGEDVVYVGSSAGSMVCAKTQYVSEWYPNEEEPGSSLTPGLGFIDFEIFPHFEEHLLPEIKKHWRKGTLYLLKNGEAITVINGTMRVLGEERKIEVSHETSA